jgi:agmatine deiminase
MKSIQTKRPVDLGFYMPAEWEPHAATWLSWPKDPETWPDRVPKVQDIYLQMLASLTPHETVELLVDDVATEQDILNRCKFRTENIHFHHVRTVDSWIRDYGPNFLVNGQGELAYNDWIFNAWGNKYEELKQDDFVPKHLESFLKVERFEPGIVLEGGSIEVNGAGCVLTTEQCLLNSNRNPHLNRDDIEQYLKQFLGVSKILWLGEGIAGDDTDGHIDDVARFAAPDVILCSVEDDPTDPNYQVLQDNFERLKRMTDARARPLSVIPLPMPGGISGSSTNNRNLDRLPASYANFYIANQIVLAPVFGHANDSRALETLQRVFPNRRIVPLNCEPLVWGMGTIHCVTQQQPAV